MMTPQLTEQYGQVDRVSVVRAIFSWRTWAKTGVRSNPRTDAARPPTALAFRNSRRVGSMASRCDLCAEFTTGLILVYGDASGSASVAGRKGAGHACASCVFRVGNRAGCGLRARSGPERRHRRQSAVPVQRLEGQSDAVGR